LWTHRTLPLAACRLLSSAALDEQQTHRMRRRGAHGVPYSGHPQQLLTRRITRLQTELMQLMTAPAPGVSAFPSADGNLLSWRATIEGPDDTPYAGLTFKLSFEFPTNYPYAPPNVTFRTPIYHPNVDFSGRICLDILKDKWTAAYNTQTVLLSLQSLLGEPNK
jgi:ubiquitin-protein ligase